MGKWAESAFGRDSFGNVGIIVAGTSPPELQKTVLDFFDRTITSNDKVYHTYLAEKNSVIYPIVFNVYGAPAMMDILAEMHDGGCCNVLFVGYAYGFKNLAVGSIIVANRSYHFDGMYHALKLDRISSTPDRELKKKLEALFTKNKVEYVKGVNISVPAVTFQLPHANKEYQKIRPATLEMELAACISRAKDIGMRTAGVLIISDNRKTSLNDEAKRRLRMAKIKRVLKLIVDNITDLTMPPMRRKKRFGINEHLASIIDDPTDSLNVYRSS